MWVECPRTLPLCQRCPKESAQGSFGKVVDVQASFKTGEIYGWNSSVINEWMDGWF